MEPIGLSIVASGLTSIIKVTEYSAQYAGVTRAVRQLQINVQLAAEAINTANRLMRLKPYLDREHLVADTNRNIKHTEDVLKLLQDTVEACRKDIELKNTVGFNNRLKWIVFKEKDFLDKLATLTNALGCLNRDILRMENVPAPQLPTYGESMQEQEGPVRRFPRSPSRRVIGTAQRQAQRPVRLEDVQETSSSDLTYITSAPAEMPGSFEWGEHRHRQPAPVPEQEEPVCRPLLRPDSGTVRRRSNFI